MSDTTFKITCITLLFTALVATGAAIAYGKPFIMKQLKRLKEGKDAKR